MPATTPRRPLPAEVRAKLGKLVPRLGSSHAGEQVATVTAMGRVLAAANLDWHDLTGAIVAPAVAPPPPPPPPPPRAYSDDSVDSLHVSADEIVNLVDALRMACSFNRSSENFLDSLLDRAARYSTVYLSPKMKKWLQDLMLQAGL